MPKLLQVESDDYDAQRFHQLLLNEDVEITRCATSSAAERMLTAERQREFAVAVILWEIPGPPSGLSLLARCRQVWPDTPVVVVSGTLDALIAARAYSLGARDFLEKPLEAERVKSCIRNLLAAAGAPPPKVEELRQTIIGEAPALIATLKQVARLLPHRDTRALLIGESGTGKELFAQAVHQLSERASAPWVAVNVGAIPATLIESALFGHERGAFTGAHAQHKGYLEEAGDGTLFLDEIGELEQSLQVKLLRVIQEKEFRRLGSRQTLPFTARLVCATNRDLAQAVERGIFRRDLFHRIAEQTIQIPPLRERQGDVDVLLNHFLAQYRAGREVRFARETLTILRSYKFPGNVRELQNLVRAALVECEGATILPQHLPLRNIWAFLQDEAGALAVEPRTPPNTVSTPLQELFTELAQVLPEDWHARPYHEIAPLVERAFDRNYLQRLYRTAHGVVTHAAEKAGVDAKTFRKRWKDSGLPALKATKEELDGGST